MVLPSVVIVGRANVGKSSLFNAICRRRVSIVDPTPGVTRDRIVQEVTYGGRTFELVDTGGVGMESEREIVTDVEMQIQIAIEQAHLVLMVVDAKAGLHPMDQGLAQRLRAAGKNVILVANKSERERDAQAAVDFFALGFGEPVRTAAVHTIGLEDLLKRIGEALPEPQAASEAEVQRQAPIKIAIVGKRNVGKSTLINFLAREPRVVVSEIPGTTRDAIDVRITVGEREFIAIDTAGVRKKGQVADSVEFFSVSRTMEAIARADVIVLIMDAVEEISDVEKKLAGKVVSEYKPCVFAMNKMDLTPQSTQAEYEEYVHSQLPSLSFAPVVCISALTGMDVLPLLDVVQELYRQAEVRVKTSELNDVMVRITAARRPPSGGARLGKIFYATQTDVRPPTFVLFTNDSARITKDYERYVSNQLRRQLLFLNIPLRFHVRRRKSRQAKAE